MARVTVEDCLRQVGNRFALTILAAERARQLSKGAEPMVECENKKAVTSLREIAQGKVKFNEDINRVISGFLQEVKIRGVATDLKTAAARK